jgi:anaerobic selenocysteine-containing dehydrogenase
MAFLQAMGSQPKLAAIMPVVLYETLGRSLGKGKESAALVWGAAQTLANSNPDSVRRAGFKGDGPALGDALFDAILERPGGVVITSDPYDVTFDRIGTEDGRIELLIPELLQELSDLIDEAPKPKNSAFPFILAAGERRTSTANTIYRDPSWRKKDASGSLRMSPGDAGRLGLETGGRVRVTTKRGSVETTIEVNDTLRDGHVTLPNGFGLEYPDENGVRKVHGVAPNELTSSEDRDWIAGTPWHKHVRAQVEAVV